MSYAFQNQGQNFATVQPITNNIQGQTFATVQPLTSNLQPPQIQIQYTQPQVQPQPIVQPQPQLQQQIHISSTPFSTLSNSALNMEQFNDPFNQMGMGMGNHMMAFGFPDIASIQRQMLGHFQNQMQSMQLLADGMSHNLNNNQQLTPGVGGQGQQGIFISMQGGGSGPGTMISKTFVSKIDYSGGQPKEESYQSQAIKQFGEGGHSISEQQEAYKNTMTGLQKAAHQRLLDDRGTKLIKERNINTGEQSEHNILKGIEENELSGFNQQYNDYREKVHFQDNYKYLNSLNPGKMVKQLGQGKGQVQTTNLMIGDGQNQNINQPGNQYPNSNIQYYSNVPQMPQNQQQQQNMPYNPFPNNQINFK